MPMPDISDISEALSLACYRLEVQLHNALIKLEGIDYGSREMWLYDPYGEGFITHDTPVWGYPSI